MRLVLDTNVLVAALRSSSGASAALLRAVRSGSVIGVASPPLFLEYEAVLKRPNQLAACGLSLEDIDVFLTALALLISPAAAGPAWRPLLPDPDDEMVMEAAINGAADAIVTFEQTTFAKAAGAFGIEVLTPGAAWRRIRP